MNLQIKLRYTRAAFARLRPTKAQHKALLRDWIGGAALPRGVQLTLTDWSAPGQSTEQVRRRVRTLISKHGGALGGCPGIVARYHVSGVTLCDYDTPDACTLAELCRVARALRLRPLWAEWRATARGWHMVVQWNRELGPGETVALQLLLGSDVRRETFNLGRILAGGGRNKRWNLLFARKLT